MASDTPDRRTGGRSRSDGRHGFGGGRRDLSIVTDPRANPLRERIEADRVALGVLENVYSPSLVELYGELDLDFV